jgi:uncharacterized damage-inducible protein DinB
MTDALQTFYRGWADYQRLLLDRLRTLTPDEVRLRTGLEMWAVWQLAAHMAGARIYWLHDVLGEGDADVRDMFRMETTTVPGLPLEDAGWEDDENHPRDAGELIEALSRTWAVLEECLKRWNRDDLAVEFQRTRPTGTTTLSRLWVLWHLLEHDLHHTGEISQILGSHGIDGLNL